MMEKMDFKEGFEKVALPLPLFYRDKFAFSANLLEVYEMIGVLVRTHATLSLLYYTKDPNLNHIRNSVKSKELLTYAVVSDVASLYPLDFVSLTAESPLVLNILSPKEIAEAIEKIFRLPFKLLGDHIDYKKKKYELEKQQKEDQKKNTPLLISPEDLEGFLPDNIPKGLIEGVMNGSTDKIFELLEVASRFEDYKQKEALTVYRSALAIQEVYKIPGFEKTPSKISQTELKVYNTELIKNSIINQTSNVHFYEGFSAIQSWKKKGYK